ncbi:MAG: hypothetical protein U0R49_09015 [Fimbriimonadales bacterium]
MAKFLILLFLAFASGCASNQNTQKPDAITGEWYGTPLTDSRTDPGSEVTKQQIEMAKASKLVLLADHTFKLSLLVDIEGRWSREGEKILLHPKTIGGTPTNTPDEKGQSVSAKDLVGKWSSGEIRLPATEPPWVGVLFKKR